MRPQREITTPTLQLNVNIVASSRAEEAEYALGLLTGVILVERVFPDGEDEELKRMFVLTVRREAADTLLTALPRMDLVETAEKCAPRSVAPRAEGP